MRARTSSGLLLLVTLLAAPSLAAAQDGPEAAMLARINQLRTEHGMAALLRDDRLDGAARAHTLDMAGRGELFHVSETTGTPIDRASAAGVTSADIAENVAMHTTVDSAQASLEASEAHLANMLNPRSTHVGLSAISAGGGVYVTQLFARLDVPAPAAAPSSDGSVVALDVPVPTAPATEPAPAAPTEPSAPTARAPVAPASSGGAIVIPPDPSGVVRVPAPAPGVSGYWICAAGRTGSRWYYYPVRPGMTGALSADLSVSGPPPGYGADSCGGATAGARAAVPPGSSTYGTSPTPPASTSRAIITPWGTVRVETRPRRR